jgi:hypothetical protein
MDGQSGDKAADARGQRRQGVGVSQFFAIGHERRSARPAAWQDCTDHAGL